MKEINAPVLKLTGLTKFFRGLLAVNNLDLEVTEGEIMGLIGPNGAGKTTVFDLVSGILKPTRGSVVFRGEDITGLGVNKIAKKGILRTFQSNTLFPDFTVMENVLMGCHLSFGPGIIKELMNFPSVWAKRDKMDEKAAAIVNFVGLTDYSAKLGKDLSHGHQRALGIGIALAADPKLLMLDEPVSGMNTTEKKTMMHLIRSIREMNITVLLVEHDMGVVMALCDRISVLNFGHKIAQGSPPQIQKNSQVIQAYLGVED